MDSTDLPPERTYPEETRRYLERVQRGHPAAWERTEELEELQHTWEEAPPAAQNQILGAVLRHPLPAEQLEEIAATGRYDLERAEQLQNHPNTTRTIQLLAQQAHPTLRARCPLPEAETRGWKREAEELRRNSGTWAGRLLAELNRSDEETIETYWKLQQGEVPTQEHAEKLLRAARELHEAAQNEAAQNGAAQNGATQNGEGAASA